LKIYKPLNRKFNDMSIQLVYGATKLSVINESNIALNSGFTYLLALPRNENSEYSKRLKLFIIQQYLNAF